MRQIFPVFFLLTPVFAAGVRAVGQMGMAHSLLEMTFIFIKLIMASFVHLGELECGHMKMGQRQQDLKKKHALRCGSLTKLAQCTALRGALDRIPVPGSGYQEGGSQQGQRTMAATATGGCSLVPGTAEKHLCEAGPAGLSGLQPNTPGICVVWCSCRWLRQQEPGCKADPACKVSRSGAQWHTVRPRSPLQWPPHRYQAAPSSTHLLFLY